MKKFALDAKDCKSFLSSSFYLSAVMLLCLIISNSVQAQESILPINIKLIPSYDADKLLLGRRLFHEQKLSSDGKLSCASCHNLETHTIDGQDFSLDNNGLPLDYNTPSIQYASLNHYLNWLGNIENLAKQIDHIIHNPRELNSNWRAVIDALVQTNEYQALFTKAGYDAINQASITDALVLFEKSLVRPSRFDYFLLGDKQQLNKQEINGFQLFKDYGCIACHQGVNIGGNMRQTFGVMGSYYDEESAPKQRDLGFYNLSGNDEDKFLFRVPSLRNVSQTGPYFHDASAQSLTQAIRVMFEFQIGMQVSQQEIEDIAAFLMSLDAINE